MKIEENGKKKRKRRVTEEKEVTPSEWKICVYTTSSQQHFFPYAQSFHLNRKLTKKKINK